MENKCLLCMGRSAPDNHYACGVDETRLRSLEGELEEERQKRLEYKIRLERYEKTLSELVEAYAEFKREKKLAERS